jgi:hypothetical protein
MSRPVLRNNFLKWLGPSIAIAIAGYFVFLFPLLPETWQKPGSPVLYGVGVGGVVLLLVSMVFVLVKRSGGGDQAPFWYVAHVICASVGAVLVAIHSAGHLSRPPALLYLAIVALMVLGIWARVRLAARVSATFGEKHKSFATGANKTDRETFRILIDDKIALLNRLDPAASEAIFSLRPVHWFRHPLLAKQYQALVTQEATLLGTRKAVPAAQAYWRTLHMALAYLFVAGVVIHVITVTFFAGYVADYNLNAITWWHLTKW